MTITFILKKALLLGLPIGIIVLIYVIFKYPQKVKELLSKVNPNSIKNYIKVNLKTSILVLLITLLPFIVLYGVSRTIVADLYWFEWTIDNNYVYLWLVVIVLTLTKKYIIATFIAYGNAIGIVLGQYLGDAIHEANIKLITDSMSSVEISELHLHPAPQIWLYTILISITVSIILNILIKYRRSNKK